MILQLKFEIRPRSLKLCIKFIPIQVSNDTIKQKANYNDHWNSQFQRRTKSLQFDLSLISSYKHVLPKIGKCPHTLKLYRTLWVSRVVLSIITCWKYQDLLNLAYILFAMVVSCTAVRASIRRSRPKSQYEQTRANRRSQNPSSRIRRSREDGKVLWTFAHKSQQSTHVREKRLHRPREPYTQSILRSVISAAWSANKLASVSSRQTLSFGYRVPYTCMTERALNLIKYRREKLRQGRVASFKSVGWEVEVEVRSSTKQIFGEELFDWIGQTILNSKLCMKMIIRNPYYTIDPGLASTIS